MPRVSVILPCFNAAEMLGEALDSLLGQTYRDFEVVLFDDGSTDETAEVADRYAKRNPRVRVISSEHVGIVEGLRRACAAAAGEFLARMDADDVAHPERLALQVARLDGEPELALCGTLVEPFGEPAKSGRKRYDDWVNSLVEPAEIERELFVECPIPHPTFCLRRGAFEEAGGYRDEAWAEDYDLVMRIALAGGGLGKVGKRLLRWRNHGARLSSNDVRYSLANFRALKRHYLAKSHLRDGRPFVQWGAGEVGKRWLLEWPEGIEPEAVVDINPRKVGRTIHGVPVIAPEVLGRPGERLLVVAVGAPGAREDIRAWLEPRGYVEVRDYLFVA